jgi:peptidoglycan/xylan/chitin deacetylase (PgdA/CDA1 family)
MARDAMRENRRMAVEQPSQAPPDTYYLHEQYPGVGRRSSSLSVYYAIKPLLPRRTQLAARRAYARRQARRTFPAWPIEPILVERWHDGLRKQIAESTDGRVPLVGLWPDGHRFAAVLTHDVEGPRGIELLPQVLEIERRHGFVSSWNLVAEWYPIPDGVFDEIRAAGGEIGLHGVRHDGKLFRSRGAFRSDLPRIREYMEKWGAVGFRSPATHRNAEWMHELGCLYDSSFPDTDPFEPQPGGCCSILPFFFGDVVELPITLVQDHTLFEILRPGTIDPWLSKSRWIIRNHGLINLIIHPDYMDRPERLDAYESFLSFLKEQAGGWHALPREVAEWWKHRADLRCGEDGVGSMQIVGPVPEHATVAWALIRDGELRYEPEGR